MKKSSMLALALISVLALTSCDKQITKEEYLQAVGSHEITEYKTFITQYNSIEYVATKQGNAFARKPSVTFLFADFTNDDNPQFFSFSGGQNYKDDLLDITLYKESYIRKSGSSFILRVADWKDQRNTKEYTYKSAEEAKEALYSRVESYIEHVNEEWLNNNDNVTMHSTDNGYKVQDRSFIYNINEKGFETSTRADFNGENVYHKVRELVDYDVEINGDVFGKSFYNAKSIVRQYITVENLFNGVDKVVINFDND